MTHLEPPAGPPGNLPGNSLAEPLPEAPAPSSAGGDDRRGPVAVSTGAETRPDRPPAVTIVALLLLVASIGSAALGLYALISAQIVLPPAGGLLDLAGVHLGSLTGAIALRQVVSLVVAFVGGVALLQMRRRGWLLAMVAAVLVLAAQLTNWWYGEPNYLMMTAGVAVVLLMNQAELREAFEGEASI